MSILLILLRLKPNYIIRIFEGIKEYVKKEFSKFNRICIYMKFIDYVKGKQMNNNYYDVTNHEIKSFNFEFMLNTGLEEYYEKLVDDEIIFSKKPTNEKIYMDCRVISEAIVKAIVIKSLEINSLKKRTFDENLEKLKGSIPDEIYKKFSVIKKNGNIYGHPDSPPYTATVEEIFRIFHSCLIWYLRYLRSNELIWDENYDVNFIIPNHKITGENEKRYLSIIGQQKRDYDEIKKELQEARKTISELNDTLKETKEDIKEYNKTISEQKDQIKKFKIELNNIQNNKDIEILRKKLEESEKELQKSRNKNELLNKTVLNLSKSIDDNKEDNFTVDYEDINTIKNLRGSISEELKDVTNKIEEASNEIKSFKQLLQQDDNIQFSTHSAFYKAFMNLEGEQLRKIYVTLEKLNIATLLITTIKNKLNKSNIDEMQKFIDDEARKLNLYSDEEIKFKLYYKLMKICNISSGCFANEKEFKGNLDKIVKFAYSTLESKKDFKRCGNELETINSYYMNKIIDDFEGKFNESNEEIQKELLDQIYNNFEKLPENQKKQLYDKLNIKNTSEDAVKLSMKAIGPSVMLSTLVGLGGFASYTTLSSIIFGVSHLLGVTFSFGVYTGAASLLSFLTGPFMIFVLIGSGFFAYGQGKKQKVDLVPMIIMQICVSEEFFNSDNNYEAKYGILVSAWREKQNHYRLKNTIKSELSDLVNQLTEVKRDLENEYSKENKLLESLRLNLEQGKEMFKIKLLISDKISSLHSYNEFSECNNKLYMLTNKSNSSTGIFNKIISKVKDQTQEYMLKVKINQLEKALLLEALDSELFYSDTMHLKHIEKDIEEKCTEISKLNGRIKEERIKIDHEVGKIKNIEFELKNIKEEFFDIDSINV